jgi:sugar transferase (PEP-CTERM/EpsH1 system associated)
MGVNVLVLSTQFPYPPRSGFEMRVYQLVRGLAARHSVTLLSFAEAHERDDVAELSREVSVRTVEYRPARGLGKRRAQLTKLVSRLPYACHHVHSEEMQAAITELCSSGAFDIVQLESSLFCQYAFPSDVRLVLDEHNIEYEVLFRMYQNERSLPRRAFSWLEYVRFRRFEQEAWRDVDGCLVCSEREAEVLHAREQELPVTVVPNGVDIDHFRPALASPEPETVVFNGVLNYRPNLDAALHLVDDIWPLVLARCPDARLAIVGRAGDVDVSALRRPGVEVTGEVADVRPYLQRAAVEVVPLRMGGGTRLKVVEGLALGKAMVSTSLGCEGIAVRDREHLLIADDAASFADRIVALFVDPAWGERLGRAGRKLVEHTYSWDLAGERLVGLYEQVLERPATASGAPRPVVPSVRARA